MTLQNSIRRAVGLTLLFCGALGVGATTLIRMDLNALAHSAEIIVRARCRTTQSQWESGSIWTFASFQVLETFKGAPPQSLRVRLVGGRIANLQTRVEGVPQFSVGEELILFLERNSAGDLGITGWAQGTFRVTRNSSGEVNLSQDSSHFAVFDPQTRKFTPSGINHISLADFRQKLSDALNAPVPTGGRK
jgi:hypothetical protein